ncbi:MAG: carboxymuconolactone decarboxylase family protein [Chlorobi bacterium]|nr:carboxymuconolactone decarboxylase family protein [Chlorobiota bacterium]
MAHIELNNPYPGISGLLAFRPVTAAPLNHLAETLLRGESPLPQGERELIAGYVSHLNNCRFCTGCHIGAAQCLLNDDGTLMAQVKQDAESADISEKMKALLAVAAAVQKTGKAVTAEIINRAKSTGASDVELHDTVLIAAAFCMFNRYVDGLGTWAPEDEASYVNAGKRLAAHGYLGE